MIGFGNFQGHPGIPFDQFLQGFGWKDFCQRGSLGVLGNVFRPTAVGAGQMVGVLQANTVDQHLKRVGQLADIDLLEVVDFHVYILVMGMEHR
ncbi:hypothetical protein D3C75_875250 [compost metagenome]